MKIGTMNNIVYSLMKIKENLSMDKSMRISDPYKRSCLSSLNHTPVVVLFENKYE